jgi:hypothetical protein
MSQLEERTGAPIGTYALVVLDTQNAGSGANSIAPGDVVLSRGPPRHSARRHHARRVHRLPSRRRVRGVAVPAARVGTHSRGGSHGGDLRLRRRLPVDRSREVPPTPGRGTGIPGRFIAHYLLPIVPDGARAVAVPVVVVLVTTAAYTGHIRRRRRASTEPTLTARTAPTPDRR